MVLIISRWIFTSLPVRRCVGLTHLSWPSSAVWWCLMTSSWCLLWPSYILKNKNKNKTSAWEKCVSVPVCALHVGLPLAWSLSSWLATFFHSSILSSSGVIRLSERALKGRLHNRNDFTQSEDLNAVAWDKANKSNTLSFPLKLEMLQPTDVWTQLYEVKVKMFRKYHYAP